MQRVQELRASGRPKEALAALRGALRVEPDSAEARQLLAEVYIDLGDGLLAESALEQAVSRGIPSDRATVLKAQILFLKEDYGDLIALEMPAGLAVGERLRILFLKAEAEALRATGSKEAEEDAAKAYLALFREIQQHADSASVESLSAELQTARHTRPVIERAWQHFECANSASPAVEWQPLDRPGGRVIRVGPSRAIKTIGEAADVAQDGDIVEIDSGTYTGGVAHWTQDDIVVRGAGERPVITADGREIRRRDVWLFTGNNVVVENVEISGARSPWENGAAIRHTGAGLRLRHVYLHDNENGLLTGNDYPETGQVLIEFSEFARNGDGKGFAHNIYVGRSRSFEMRYSFSHTADAGHLLKSRATENRIAYNRFSDGEQGNSSYVIDIAEGGVAEILGNMIEHGPATLNHGMVSYAGEAISGTENRLLFVNNSIYNRHFEGVALRNHAGLDVQVVNNLFGGAPMRLGGEDLTRLNNLTFPDHGMSDPRNYDYSLVAGARAVDAGAHFAVIPDKEYVHPVKWRERQEVWRIDVGAFERCGL